MKMCRISGIFPYRSGFFTVGSGTEGSCWISRSKRGATRPSEDPKEAMTMLAWRGFVEVACWTGRSFWGCQSQRQHRSICSLCGGAGGRGAYDLDGALAVVLNAQRERDFEPRVLIFENHKRLVRPPRLAALRRRQRHLERIRRIQRQRTRQRGALAQPAGQHALANDPSQKSSHRGWDNGKGPYFSETSSPCFDFTLTVASSKPQPAAAAVPVAASSVAIDRRNRIVCGVESSSGSWSLGRGRGGAGGGMLDALGCRELLELRGRSAPSLRSCQQDRCRYVPINPQCELVHGTHQSPELRHGGAISQDVLALFPPRS